MKRRSFIRVTTVTTTSALLLNLVNAQGVEASATTSADCPDFKDSATKTAGPYNWTAQGSYKKNQWKKRANGVQALSDIGASWVSELTKGTAWKTVGLIPATPTFPEKAKFHGCNYEKDGAPSITPTSATEDWNPSSNGEAVAKPTAAPGDEIAGLSSTNQKAFGTKTWTKTYTQRYKKVGECPPPKKP